MKRIGWMLALMLMLLTGAQAMLWAAPGDINTVAGSGVRGYGGDGGQATSAKLTYPTGLTTDSAGNLYIGDTQNHRVRKVTPAGIISTYAGNGNAGFSGDGGQATSAQLNEPVGLTMDATGNLFIADYYNSRIRKVTPAGIISTVAGTGTAAFGGDGGQATSAQLWYPYDVAVDGTGNLFISDYINHRIRKVNTSGVISTIAGDGGSVFNGDGVQATSASLSYPNGVAVRAGNVYISDFSNHRIRKVDTNGIITTIAGTGTRGFSGDRGPATSAQISGPYNVSFDSAGNLFFVDSFNYRLRKIGTDGIITTVAGNGGNGFGGDGGRATSASLYSPLAVTVDSADNFYIAGSNDHRVRKGNVAPVSLSINDVSVSEGNLGLTTATFTVTNSGDLNKPITFNYTTANGNAIAPGDYVAVANGSGTIAVGTESTTISITINSDTAYEDDETFSVTLSTPSIGTIARATGTGTIVNDETPYISTYAGTGTAGYNGDGGAATAAQIKNPTEVALDGAGNLYIADYNNHRIRKVTPAGVISTYAGNGTPGFSGDGGAATDAQLNQPHGVTADGAGNLYIADNFNNRIRKVTPGGIISTVAGNGTPGYSGDGGQATSAKLWYPTSVAVDGTGNIFICDYANHSIRKVNTGGVISTVAGSGNEGLSGDGGPATSAKLRYPYDVEVDGAGNLYIADTKNDRIRKVNTSGVISTIVGTGTAGFSGDGGPATSAQIYNPYNIALDNRGNLYIADTYTSRLRKVGVNGVISTLAGNGSFSSGGDGGPATGAQLNFASGVALDGAGNIYIAETNSSRIRKIGGAPIILSINDVLVNEGTSGTTTATFTVTNSGDTGSAITFNYATSDGSAQAPGDYIAVVGGSGTIAAGRRSTTISIIVNGDTNFESVEKFGVTLSNPSLGTIARATGTGTILDGEIAYITTYAGNGNAGFSGDGGAATSAQINSPYGVVADGAGNLYIADKSNSRIRKVTPTGVISTVAGFAGVGFSGDGGASTSARVNQPRGVALDREGNLYIADTFNNRIRKVNTSGVISTVAGNGTAGFNGDGGAATSAQINNPYAVAVDDAGNFYIADTLNNRIRKVNTSGIISTIAGDGTASFGGDGGAATGSQLNNPGSVNIDGAGNLIIADTLNNRIRKINTSGVISTIAGGGTQGLDDGGPATGAQLNNPGGANIDNAGILYIADTLNNRIRKVNTSGIISTYAGNGTAGFSGDGGPATGAQINNSNGVATDGAGNVYIADTNNHRIRKVGAPPPITLSINDVVVNEGDSGTTTATFTVTRNGNITEAVTFNYATANGTATAGSDYVAATGTGTIALNALTTTISITINGDQGREPNEAFTVTLSAPSSGSIIRATGTGTITNDDSGLIVTTTSDASTASDNFNSLREAITTANANAGADSISFNLPTSDGGYSGGVWTIAPTSNLPTISGANGAATTIDGYTQPGANANTLASGSDAVLKIQLQPTGTRSGNGLTISAANCIIKGLSVVNCYNGIFLNGAAATGNTLSGNYLGIKADGITKLANSFGVVIESASNNTIGGLVAGARNVISGNAFYGVYINGSASGNTLSGNTIGAKADGSTALANSYGVYIENASNNVIGGTAPGARNIISGNYDGLTIAGVGATGNTVSGNYIGTKADGNTILANIHGVVIDGAPNNIIGGLATGARNVISGNTYSGIEIRDGDATGNSVRGNSIFGNGGIGINLGGGTETSGVTANDPDDADIGPNNLQNFPLLTKITSSGGNSIIKGTLNSIDGQDYVLDFYSNAAAHSSGYGEGKTYLGSSTAITSDDADTVFSVTLTGVSLTDGDFITATATRTSVSNGSGALGDTSEFSLAKKFVANTAPTGIALDNASMTENQAAGATVGTFSTTDPDAGNAFTYTFVAGTGADDNASFTIDGDTLKTAASFNFETKSSYQIRIRTTDAGGLSFDEPFTITVTNVAEAATVATGAATSITNNGATLNGVVNPSGEATTAQFEYGTTTDYGNTTAMENVGTGTSDVSVSANLNGLAPRTLYHFRVSATNSAGTTVGIDRTLTTLETPSFIVSTKLDVVDATDGETSLREAIAFANSDPDTSTVEFAPALAGQTITLGSKIDLTQNVIIAGPSAPAARVTVEGTENFSLLGVDQGVTASLFNLTINKGNNGIDTAGTTVIANCTFSNNANIGIFNNGTATVINSLARDNGVHGLSNNGTAIITNSTFINNASYAILNEGTATVTNATISGNKKGIGNASGTTTLSNSLVVGNTISNLSGDAVNAISFGSDSLTTGTAAAAGLEVDGGGKPVLKANGGATQAIALTTRGTAVNAGSNALVPTDITDMDGDENTAEEIPFDGRGVGFARIKGSTVDIGAYESSILPNVVPVASAQNVTTAEDTSKVITLAATDEDANDTLSFKLTSLPTNGTLRDGSDANAQLITAATEQAPYTLTATGADAGKLFYQPNLNINGTDNFSFFANDGIVDSAAAATASITITAVNDAPVASPVESFTTPQNVAKKITLAGSDADNDALTFIITSLPTRGTLYDGADTTTAISTVPYELTDAQHRVTLRSATVGAGSFDFAVNDGMVNSAEQTVNYTISDANMPTIAITTPVNGSISNVFNSISGVASDNVAVVRVELYLQRQIDKKFWNGTSWTAFFATDSKLSTVLSATQNGVTWARTAALPTGASLQSGPYFIAARAFDAEGNGTSATATINYDATAPTVAFASPLDNSATNAQPVIKGFAADGVSGSGVIRVDVTLRRNGFGDYWNGTNWAGTTPVAFASTLASNNWSCNGALPVVQTPNAAQKLTDGTYTVTATAIDRAGNSSKAINNFTVDTKKPLVAILSPANASTVSSLSVANGTTRDVSNGSSVANVDLYLRRLGDGKYWNGTTWTAFSATASKLATTLFDTGAGKNWNRSNGLPTGANLTPGNYTLSARATDRAGNGESATSNFAVTANPKAQAEVSPVALSSANAKTDGTLSLTFTGALGASAGDASSYTITQNGAVLEVNSVQQPSSSEVVLTVDGLISGARFSVNYDLKDGQGRSISGIATGVIK